MLVHFHFFLFLFLLLLFPFFFFFFFNDTATTEIYTLSLHDALPISASIVISSRIIYNSRLAHIGSWVEGGVLGRARSEEHTSELQSQFHLVCRLLLEKKKKKKRKRSKTCKNRKHIII